MLKYVPKLPWMTFEGWISFHYPLSVGDAPLLEAVKLNNVALSWHKMVELSKFLCGTSVRDLKLGFKCEKASQVGRFVGCGLIIFLLFS